MTGQRLIDIYIKYRQPQVYHTDGLPIGKDPIDIAVLSNSNNKNRLYDRISACLRNLADDGHIFLSQTGGRYDDTIQSIVEDPSYSVDILDVGTIPSRTYVITKSRAKSTLVSVSPDYLSWVHEAVCTKPVTGLVDVVYTLADAPSDTDDEELRISLRSVATFGVNLDKVWIVSDRLPDWITNVNHLKVPDTYNNCKDANIINKVLAACTEDRVSDRFIFMSDDQVFNTKIPLNRISPTYNPRGIKHFSLTDGNRWSKRMHNTLRHIENAGGCPNINWDSHCPQPIDKAKFYEIMTGLPYTSLPGMCINTAYFGNKLEPALIPQNMVKNTFEGVCEGSIILNKAFIGYNDAGYRSGLREKLLEKFPNKSKYEV